MSGSIGFIGGVLLVISLMLVAVMAVVLSGSKKKKLHYVFSAFLLAAAVWVAAIAGFLLTESRAYAFFWSSLFYVAAICIVYSFLLIAYLMPTGRTDSTKLSLRRSLIAFAPAAIAISVAIGPGAMVADVSIGGVQNTAALEPISYLVYVAVFVTYVALASYILIRKFIATEAGFFRKQVGAIAISGIAGLSIGAVFNLFLPLYGNYLYIWVGPLCGVPLVVTILYAIVKWSILDVKHAAVRSVTYIAAIASLTLIYYGAAYGLSTFVFGKSHLAIPYSFIGLAVLLGLFFRPIWLLFDTITNRLFYRRNYNVEDFVSRLSRKLAATTNLETLLEGAIFEITTTLKAEAGVFHILLDDAAHSIVSVGTIKKKKIASADVALLTEYMQSANTNLVLAKEVQDNERLRRFFIAADIELAMPLFYDGDIFGYIFLNARRIGQYTARDTKTLLTVRDELVIAIQNAFSVYEIRKLNDTLQQRIDNATKELRESNQQLQKLDEAKDEFISMASHQLRTPLTSVKGYLDMVIEGDVGKVNAQQKQLLTEAFSSSERMVHLINDFLSVSRLQTGKFIIDKRPVDLSKILEQEVDSLKRTAKSHSLKLNLNIIDQVNHILLDENKVRQVIMNFIDNAIYYSPADTAIKVELRQEVNYAAVTVTDAGIGVPEKEQKQLFKKFSRATNAQKRRPDGTGVGLYLAKKVIAAHDGEIIFTSKEGKGSTFGFRLPLKKN